MTGIGSVANFGCDGAVFFTGPAALGAAVGRALRKGQSLSPGNPSGCSAVLVILQAPHNSAVQVKRHKTLVVRDKGPSLKRMTNDEIRMTKE